MKIMLVVGLLLLIGIFSVAYAALPGRAHGFYGNFAGGANWQSPMGFGAMGGFGYNQFTRLELTQALPLIKRVAAGTEAFQGNDTVIITSSRVSLLVFTMGHERAINLTGQAPPAYADHDVFVIDGLIDPKLVFEGSTEINLTTINFDSSMYHNFVVTTQGPPYPYNSMPYEMQGGMVPFLPPANYGQGYAYAYSYEFSLTSGHYWYICTYPGHAQMGMYGELQVNRGDKDE